MVNIDFLINLFYVEKSIDKLNEGFFMLLII